MNFSKFITEDTGSVKYAYYALCNSDIMAKVKKAHPKPSQVDMTNEGSHIEILVMPKDGTVADFSKIKTNIKSLINQILKPERLNPRVEFGDSIKIYV